jgi:hypothetical protein
MRAAPLIALTLITGTTTAQLVITNGSFESMVQCPEYPGDVERATGWRSVVPSVDYLNCGFTIPAYPSSTGAHNGTGCMDFASGGDTNGSAEAFGQNLGVPMAPGIYPITVAVKIASGGSYSNDCGGLAVYGFPDTLPEPIMQIHISQLPGTVLLGVSQTVDNTAWEWRLFDLNVPATMRSIIFTTQQTPGCSQVIFIDDISTEGSVNALAEPTAEGALELYPNPVTDRLIIRTANDALPLRWTLTDAAGRVQATGTLRNTASTIDLSALATGTYLLHWTDAAQQKGVQRVIKARP